MLGDPRIWTTLVTIVALAAAFAVVSPHRLARLPRSAATASPGLTAVAVASPVIAFPLAVGVTDPPVIALTCLALAWADRGKAGQGRPCARASPAR